MTYKLDNNITSLLAEPLTSGATTVKVRAGEGSLFPIPSILTVEQFNSDNKCIRREIIEATAVSGDDITITRAFEACIQDDTSNPKSITNIAKDFNSNDIISLYLTKLKTDEFGEQEVTETKTDPEKTDEITIIDKADGNTKKNITIDQLCGICNTVEFSGASIIKIETNKQNRNTNTSVLDKDYNLYTSQSTYNGDGGTSNTYFLKVTKTDLSGSIVKDIMINESTTRELVYSEMYIYNNFLYIVGKQYEIIRIFKFDLDLNLISAKNITGGFIADDRGMSQQKIGGVIRIGVRPTGSNASTHGFLFDYDLEGETISNGFDINGTFIYSYSTLERSMIVQNNKTYFIPYNGIYNVLEDDIRIEQDGTGRTYMYCIGGDGTNILTALASDIFVWDNTNNLTYSKRLTYTDGKSRSIYAIKFINNQYWLFLSNTTTDSKVDIAILNTDMTIVGNIEITQLEIDKLYLLGVKYDEVNNIIGISTGQSDLNSTEYSSHITMKTDFIEGTFQDGNCQYTGTTDAFTIANYSQNKKNTATTKTSFTPTVGNDTLTTTTNNNTVLACKITL